MDALNDLIENRPRRGFWKCFKLLRRQGRSWNHKRVYRVYCQMGLNRKRRAKPRVPSRHPEPLSVPGEPNQVWSADFMSDALYGGNRFRTFNVMDHFNREAVAIEIDTSHSRPRPGWGNCCPMETINPPPRAWKTDRSRSPLLLLLRRQLFQRDSISEYDGRQCRGEHFSTSDQR